jgi:hypothetical protein
VARVRIVTFSGNDVQLTRLRAGQSYGVSDQLGDYRVDDRHTQAHVHGPGPRSMRDLDRSPDLLHTEAVIRQQP